MNHRARKRFGQHFLTAPETIEQIVSAINPAAGEIIVEIGPGQAAITQPLSVLATELHAIEFDRDLVDGLRARMGREQAEAPLQVPGGRPVEIHLPDRARCRDKPVPAGGIHLGGFPEVEGCLDMQVTGEVPEGHLPPWVHHIQDIIRSMFQENPFLRFERQMVDAVQSAVPVGRAVWVT